MTATTYDPEAEKVAHILGGCDWGPWFAQPCPGWRYWRRCTFPPCGAYQFTMDTPSEPVADMRPCEAWPIPPAPRQPTATERMTARSKAGKAAAKARREALA